MKFYLDNTEDIFLYQLLKAAGVFEEYAHIRRVTVDGLIQVNDRTVLKQRTRLFPGDEVKYKDIHIKIIAGKSPPEQRDDKPEFHDKLEYRDRSGIRDRQETRDKPEVYNKPEVIDKPEVREERVYHGKTQNWQQKPLKKERNLRSELEKETLRLHNHLQRADLTLAIAESCTGGMASEYLTSLPGASTYFLGSVVSYSNEVKIKLLAVADKILKKDGAVSEATAVAMAAGVRTNLGSNISGAITGIAGPEGEEPGKPVGTVYIAVKNATKKEVQRFQFSGNRQEIRMRSCLELFRMLYQISVEIEQ